jgi:hypothetical protein
VSRAAIMQGDAAAYLAVEFAMKSFPEPVVQQAALDALIQLAKDGTAKKMEHASDLPSLTKNRPSAVQFFLLQGQRRSVA